MNRLEAETGDPPATTLMEIGRPTVIPPHRWWPEGEQRGSPTTAGEEAGVSERAGGWVGICEPPGFQGWCVLPTHTHTHTKLRLPALGVRLTGE